MLSLVEQAFVGSDEKRAPLKTPAWEATSLGTSHYLCIGGLGGGKGIYFHQSVVIFQSMTTPTPPKQTHTHTN